MHIVRNAVDHGLELPDERVWAHKPTAGRLRLPRAARVGKSWSRCVMTAAA